ncbi:leader peptidase (prepilin peptidase)/N-methyltransferase [Glaciihabitans tibetensis]|uniref:Prepilin leader peptidase/N-methyltransferase n=1 Tax=Glaciihabitans tibetensis TaxID=1266600 RepID=A0A2T0VBK9_9MICO|nr:A24 family peptidase [Glaciihabitans tibetensis]PRY67541.1 leader peptidase (prepilin peptidase)/N-methyltransferase [Glaciihabitans tibetensis]
MSAALLISALGGSLGLAIGSFLNVVVWRVPRGESLVAPPSACPRCSHPIRARDNVPVASWLLLRGRCRDCAEPIRARYPLVEATTALAFVALTLYYVFEAPGRLAELPALLFLAATSISLALIDIDTHTLPNRIVLPAYPIGAALLLGATAVAGEWEALVTAFIGASLLFSFYLALALAYPRGMGLGDVKLAGVLGLYLGWFGWAELAVGAFAAFLLGGAYSVALLAAGRVQRGGGVPFGPWMLAGAWVGILLGERIAHVYLTSVGLTSVGLTSVGLN